MLKKRYLPLLPVLMSAATYAQAQAPRDQLLVEIGAAYNHAYYKSSVVAPESFTEDFPSGFAINPKNHYPNNFWGGYFGLSLYSHCWLLNGRFEIYEDKTKNDGSYTTLSLAPVRASLTADYVFGNFDDFSYGIGAGAVIENLNKGTFWVSTEADPGTEGNSTLDGRTRLDPVVEVFVMKKVSEAVGIKLNVGYQIPVHNRVSDGDLVVNLGVNLGFPV